MPRKKSARSQRKKKEDTPKEEGRFHWMGDAVYTDHTQGNAYHDGFIYEDTEYYVDDCLYVKLKNEKKVIKYNYFF